MPERTTIILANPRRGAATNMLLWVQRADAKPEEYFVLVPRETWESFLGVKGRGGQGLSVEEAYQREISFWEWLALNRANGLARNEEGQAVARDLEQLKALYREWKREAG